jgi:hypothetical protein
VTANNENLLFLIDTGASFTALFDTKKGVLNQAMSSGL